MDLESEHVHKVYSKIAPHFSDTRFKPWPRIAEFLRQQSLGSLIADVGCGNGKYLGVNPAVFCLGSDICPELVEISRQRGHQVSVCDCLHLPYRTGVFDAVICIAVVHHLSTEERRIMALKEMRRILKSGGHMLVYVWALEQDRKKFDSQDVMVPWHLQPKYIPGNKLKSKPSSQQAMGFKDTKSREKKRQKKEQKKLEKLKSRSQDQELYTTYSDESRVQEQEPCIENHHCAKDDDVHSLSELSSIHLSENDIAVAPHKLTETDIQTWPDTLSNSKAPDVLVYTTEATTGSYNSPDRLLPSLKQNGENSQTTSFNDSIHGAKGSLKEQGYQTFQRYYHVFRKGELVELISKTNGLLVVEEFFDHENWCVIAKKD